MQRLSNYIDGELTGPSSGRFLENLEPATGLVYSEAPDSDASDIDRAVDAADTAFPAWAGAPLYARARALCRLAELIEQGAEKLAQAESIDAGKPLSAARQVDIPRAAANFQFFGSAIQHFFSESHAMGTEAVNYTLRAPLGVVGCISPWNLPLYLFTWKIAPALAAGNTVVAKPSELTPMTAYLFSEICREAKLPRGVLNIVHGTGAKVGQSLVEHPKVQAISFTGGTQTGARIAATAAPRFKKLSLELGGKNPNIVFADCDFERAVATSVRASFFNQGEICLSGSRVFVERPIFERFRDEFVRRTQALRVLDPLVEGCDVGALISEHHLNKVLSYIALAREEGGRILVGGRQVHLGGRCKGGYFVEPTVVEGLSPHCRVNQEEIFGPVATLTPFDREDEAVDYANNTPYGLSATIWSENIGRCHRLANRLQCGVIWINCWLLRDLRTPFGGMKQSGLGREGGFEALRFFTEPKNVCVYFGGESS
jgi:aminomuconate-semialdehyde/2-hydroxymuconate-6-semialdehyde dehydrogenase